MIKPTSTLVALTRALTRQRAQWTDPDPWGRRSLRQLDRLGRPTGRTWRYRYTPGASRPHHFTLISNQNDCD